MKTSFVKSEGPKDGFTHHLSNTLMYISNDDTLQESNKHYYLPCPPARYRYFIRGSVPTPPPPLMSIEPLEEYRTSLP